MIAIWKREFKSYFNNMSGYLFISIFLLFAGLFTTVVNLVDGYTQFEYALQNIGIIFLLIIPILTMRSIADDRHSKTDALLYSLPIKLSSIVIGKYLAMTTILLIPILVLTIYPLILSVFGDVSLVNAYTGLLGLFLLGATLIAICMFMSSLTESQVIAAVSGIGVSLLLYFMETFASLIPSSPVISLVGLLLIEVAVAWLIFHMSKNAFISVSLGALFVAIALILFFIKQTFFSNLLENFLKKLAIFSQFGKFSIGLFDIGSIIYYLSLVVLFIFFTVQSLEKRRYS